MFLGENGRKFLVYLSGTLVASNLHLLTAMSGHAISLEDLVTRFESASGSLRRSIPRTPGTGSVSRGGAGERTGRADSVGAARRDSRNGDGAYACEISTDGMPERASRGMRRYRGRGYGFGIQEEKLARIFDPMFSIRHQCTLL